MPHVIEQLLQVGAGLIGIVVALFAIFLLDRQRWRAARRRRARAEAALLTRRPPTRVAAAPRPAPQGRCPFCHEDVEALAAVVCALCLARHHAPCWDEGGACGACRSTERYGRIEERSPRAREQG